MRIKQVNAKKDEVRSLLLHLQQRCLPYDEPYDTDYGWWWIVYDGHIPVGFAGLVRSASWSDTGYLCRAGVVPSYRGRGIQNRLIAVRIRKARKLGYNWLVSDTRDNPASANSLINQGFKLFDPTNPWGYSDALYWRKRLTDAVQGPRSKKVKTSRVFKGVLRKKPRTGHFKDK